MSAVLLDTTVLIDILRGRPDASRRLAGLRRSGDVPCASAVNVEEVTRGLRPSEEMAANALIDGLVIVPLGAAEGWRAGQWRRSYSRRGITLSQADCLVAAAALTAGGRLATVNPRDFPMSSLRVEHWPAGE
jgi:predicted nucleic acid-binding protein